MLFRLFEKKIRQAERLLRERQLEARDGVSCPLTPELSGVLAVDLANIKGLVGTSGDIRITEFSFGENGEIKAAILFVDGLVNQDVLINSIMLPLKAYRGQDMTLPEQAVDVVDFIKEEILCSTDITEEKSPRKLIHSFISGDTVLVVNGFKKGLIISSKGWDKRGVSEPQTEAVVRGPREGFTESFRTNTALIRRRIKTPALRIEHMIIGEKTFTSVAVCYIEGVADDNVVKDLRERLSRINIDAVLDSGYIEQLVEDSPLSVFATVNYTEKPDVAVARMLEGRVGIIVDGSPFVLTVPMLFIESFQTAEDYYIRPLFASVTRILRYIAFLIAIFAPAIYIALTTFHQELIPTTLLFTIANAKEGTPFSAFVEALIMVFSFEILREAGLRLPRPVGQAISIVGALVMGEASVSAGLVGAPMVITIAITAVAGFVVPNQSDAASILRLVSMAFAAMLGGYGIALVFLGIMIHLATLKSFGTVYFDGLSPGTNIQDSLVRAPLWAMIRRPEAIAKNDITRTEPVLPPEKKGGGQ